MPDPVLVAVLQARLVAIAAEMGEAMLRTSYSQILNSSRDFSIAITDGACRLVAQADHIPVHVGAMPWAVRAVAAAFPDPQPGDVFLLNDPYHGGSHLPDLTAFVPVHAGGRLLFWSVVRGHQSDIGGSTHGGYNPAATEIWQEGLRVPPIRLTEGGAVRDDLVAMLAANTRNARDFRGDLAAMVGAARFGAAQLAGLVAEHGPDALMAVVDAILDASERHAHAVVSTWADGIYQGEAVLDDDGHGQENIHVRATVTVRDGEVEVDLSGSDPQVRGFCNSSYANSWSAAAMGLPLSDLLRQTGRFVHGTTVATNALLEGKGARVAMLVTAGHRDVLDMREGLKPERYNLRMPPPPPVVPRGLRLPVRERMGADGTVTAPLDPASLGAALEACGAAGVEAVAVCFLHSWRNPAHERAAAAEAARRLPGVFVTASADVLPEIKEYERWGTTVANATVGPLLQAYLARLGARLQAAGLPQPPFIILSHGGVATIEAAGRLAAGTALSGLAGGVAAAVALSRAGAGASLVTFDMGGTSTDIALLREGRAAMAGSRSIGAAPIALPSLDITTLGAGGGSIADVGPGGLLRVGPRSAGAVPGPACYRRGGTDATVTDANLVLGYLPDRLGSGFALDRSAAETALSRLGGQLGLDAGAAAAGVYRLVNARMADGVRLATVRRGVDPRGMALLAFGGAAGAHVCAVAASLGMAEVLLPLQASVLSAWGMLETDLAAHLARSLPGPVHPTVLHDAFLDMEADGRRQLAFHAGPVEAARSADMRYGEQVFEIPVPLDGLDLRAQDAHAAVEARFHARHGELFGYALPDQEVAVANARVLVTARLPALARQEVGAVTPAAAADTRRAYFDGAFLSVPVWRLEHLAAGQAVDGPALLDSSTTMLLLRGGDRAVLDSRGWLRVAVAS